MHHGAGGTTQAATGDRPGPVEETDRQLLDRFSGLGDQAAFMALVRRHARRVVGACRRVLGDAPEAEDAFQAAFLALARQAGARPWGDSVADWLAVTARRQALHARAARAARRAREGTPLDDTALSGEQAGPLVEAARRELRRVLAEELHALPAKYRAPLVLCYLEGRTNEEAARALGWPSGSVSRRLSRARALLRQRPRLRALARSVCALGAVVLGLSAGLWFRHPGEAPPQVREVMHRFRPVAEGGDGTQGALNRLETTGALPAGAERQRLLALIRETAQAADVVHDHPPGRDPERWRALSAALRRSSTALAAAVEAGDQPGAAAAVRQLNLACSTCHTAYRK